MRIREFSVSIPEGLEDQAGYVYLNHSTQYTIALSNNSHEKCDAEVSIDGTRVGVWRVHDRSSIRLERPVHDTGKFTFYRIGTPEAQKVGILENDYTGVLSVLFKPEKFSFGLCAAEPGGTGLSGESQQRFSSVAALDYDHTRFVTINLRLVANPDEPRPLFPSSNPVPPRV